MGQKSELIHPVPYHSLGLQFRDTKPDITKIISTFAQAGIPLDTIVEDLGYENNGVIFTEDTCDTDPSKPGLRQRIDSAHAGNVTYTLSFDISSPTEGKLTDIFVKNADSTIYQGKSTATTSCTDNTKIDVGFLDFYHQNTINYWTNQMQLFHDNYPFDDARLDTNIPINEKMESCENWSNANFPKTYEFGIDICMGTLPLDAKHTTDIFNDNFMRGPYKETHVDRHNGYGFASAFATLTAFDKIDGNRHLVTSLSASTGSGQIGVGHVMEYTSQKGANYSAFKTVFLNDFLNNL